MKRLIILLALILFVSCSEESTQYSQTDMNVADSVAELPECSKGNVGELAYVKDDASMRICVEGAWVATKESLRDTFYLKGDLSCETMELNDGSGLKIVCNGDSVGVVLYGMNGSNGSPGKDGANGRNGSDGKDAVLELDTLENDSERVAVSLDSLVGYSQKGPFLKGSTVYLYELSDGRTLKQTNGNFTSIITRDDGRYKFTARDMVSQYAMIVVEGNFRNEVTGEPSNSPIRLRALTDIRKQVDANVNLLTHLEFDRVYYLVTREKKTVKQAKRQAQKEIFRAFHIDTTGLAGTSENLDVFGPTDADAALLAISILMQRDTNETALSVLMTEIANDLETDGQWTDSSTRALIADWATSADIGGWFGNFRDNVLGWGLGNGVVPGFEKYIRVFWSVENKLGVCGDRNNPVNTVKYVPNRFSAKFFASDYADTSKTKVRFICDADSMVWRVATNLEKDTVGLGLEYAEGDVAHGSINVDSVYVFENSKWRHGTFWDRVVGKGCIPGRRDSVALGSDNYWYKCVVDTVMIVDESKWMSAWRVADDIEKDTATWGLDWKESETRNGRINTSLTYVFQNNHWRLGTAMDSLLNQACMEEGEISNRTYGNNYYVCTANVDGAVRGWVRVSQFIDDTHEAQPECRIGGLYADGRILSGRISGNSYVCDNGEFRRTTQTEDIRSRGCVSYILGSSVVTEDQLSYYKCTEEGWKFDIVRNTDSVEIEGRQYRTILIGNQKWMAENLNIETENSYCYYDSEYNDSLENCSKYGRLYAWEDAMNACPEGWHLPDTTEWRSLFNIANEQRNLRSATDWNPGDYVYSGNGTDSYGFSALPAGYGSFAGVAGFCFYSIGTLTSFWSSSTVLSSEYAQSTRFTTDGAGFYFGGGKKTTAYSVRCVQDMEGVNP